jgi:hypothetical protein
MCLSLSLASLTPILILVAKSPRSLLYAWALAHEAPIIRHPRIANKAVLLTSPPISILSPMLFGAYTCK